ncbi:hypothetical protein ZOSMA_2G03670 [Zostera marina]|uniref:Uncharacterized protein n=1 Tax=Zostera marina TaxID=29655 RepID=A0A0K9PDQ2_ZOSMR|nr:hypothetical protein ZOSMA_2G03670 [Zostera marina]
MRTNRVHHVGKAVSEVRWVPDEVPRWVPDEVPRWVPDEVPRWVHGPRCREVINCSREGGIGTRFTMGSSMFTMGPLCREVINCSREGGISMRFTMGPRCREVINCSGEGGIKMHKIRDGFFAKRLVSLTRWVQ